MALKERRCEGCGKITPVGDLFLDGSDFLCADNCTEGRFDKVIKLSPLMRATLEALEEYEGASLYPGTSTAEVVASGGRWHCLSKAIDLKWANSYGTNNREVPTYYRTDKGTRALNPRKEEK